MTPVYYADRNKGRMREFKLTPRRRQIMCHIAYDDGVYTALKTNFSTWSPASVPRFHLAGTDVHEIVILLRRCKLVDFNLNARGGNLHLKPLGMQILLEAICPTPS